MFSFGITRKRLLSMPPTRRHKWIKNWLEKVYLETLNQPPNLSTLIDVFKQYQQVIKWIDFNVQTESQFSSLKSYQEFFSNAIFVHQKEMNPGRTESDFLPHVKTGDVIIDEKWEPNLNYGVALDNIRSAFNVGSIFRTIDGSGLGFVVLGGYTPGPDNQQVKKTSMKTSNWVPFSHTDSLPSYLESAREDGYRIIGIETVEKSCTYNTFNWPDKAILVFGNEEYGISEKVLSTCDEFVHIPMFGFKNSINIANAFAVIAFSVATYFQKENT